jgi:hypothetical protein
MVGQAGELGGECGEEFVSECMSEFVVVNVCECVCSWWWVILLEFLTSPPTLFVFFSAVKEIASFFGPQLLAIRMRDKSRALSRTVISHRNTVLRPAMSIATTRRVKHRVTGIRERIRWKILGGRLWWWCHVN